MPSVAKVLKNLKIQINFIEILVFFVWKSKFDLYFFKEM